MFGTDLLLLAGIADRESEESLADFDVGRISPELRPLAERLGAAVVLVSHLSKGGSANGKHRVLGSIAYVGACRANYQGELAPLALGLDRR
jgi:RecA-family ATPase